MKNNNRNSNRNIRTNKFIYTEEDLAGISIIQKNIGKLNELIEELHSTDSHKTIFNEIASLLMNDLCINAGGKMFRVAECEVYYDDNLSHKDPYLYAHEKQREKLQWCFHYSGIDLTIGNGDSIVGGILIRSIIDLEADKIVSGPLRVSNCILNAAHKSALNSKSQNQVLFLESCEYENKSTPIEQSIRIGLDKGKICAEYKKSGKNESCFYNKQYRFSLRRYAEDKKYIDETVKNSKRLESILLNESK